MTDRSIIFSGPMVRALLEGRKSQTRRTVKDAPNGSVSQRFCVAPDEHSSSGLSFADEDGFPFSPIKAALLPALPGARLWVRETHKALLMGDFPVLWYRADESHMPISADQFDAMESKGWRSPIYMPRWASRLTLVVTDLRVQRLQDITAADAIAEGCPETVDQTTERHPVEWFRETWRTIHGPGAWEDNPWIAALSFTVHRCNIDEMEEAPTAGGG